MYTPYYSYENVIDSEKYFDGHKNLLYMPVSTDVCSHTNINAEYAYHTSESLCYAFYLLCTDRSKNKNTAEKIIREVLKYQYLNKNSRLFGYWGYFAEESAEKLKRPDIGLNARIGMSIVQLLQYHGKFLSADINAFLKESLINTVFCALSTYSLQNVIIILQLTYISVCCGEMFNRPEFIKYGEQILQNLYNQTLYHGAFYEYNNIRHSAMTARMLSLLIDRTNNALCLDLAKYLQDVLWKSIAVHFHRPTMQLAGPFSLCNSDFTVQSYYDFLYGALNKKVSLPHSKSLLPEPAKCPVKYYPYFAGEKKLSFSQSLVSYGMAYPNYRFSMVASTYMRPKYSLGSFNREIFWSARRPFIGYFGDAENPYCFKIDVLHDFNGFTSAALHSVQHRGYSVGHITFLLDRGDRHIDFDAPNPSIRAKDLRVRFSVIGKIDELEITHTKNTLSITHDGVTFFYSVPLAHFDGFDVKFKFCEEEHALYFDAIIHSGKSIVIDFNKMSSAILEFVFLITSSGKTPGIYENSTEKGFLHTSMTAGEFCLQLKTPVKPALEAVSFSTDTQYINNSMLEEYVIQTNERIKNYTFIDKVNQHSSVQIPIAEAINENSELNNIIESIQKTDFDKLGNTLDNILEIMSEADYSLVLQKRLAIQIAVNIFECAKSSNYRFSELIDRKYSDIFQKVTISESFETIKNHLRKLCSSIQKDKILLKDQYKNKIVISSVMKIIDDNLLNPDLSLNFIANKLGYSAAHLSRLFLESTDTNYITYVQREKLNYAIKQLRSKNKSIAEISEEIGYSNPNSFMRMFKQQTGMTISQYMKTNT